MGGAAHQDEWGEKGINCSECEIVLLQIVSTLSTSLVTLYIGRLVAFHFGLVYICICYTENICFVSGALICHRHHEQHIPGMTEFSRIILCSFTWPFSYNKPCQACYSWKWHPPNYWSHAARMGGTFSCKATAMKWAVVGILNQQLQAHDYRRRSH